LGIVFGIFKAWTNYPANYRERNRCVRGMTKVFGRGRHSTNMRIASIAIAVVVAMVVVMVVLKGSAKCSLQVLSKFVYARCSEPDGRRKL
jgi:hypothetical protein